MSHFGDKELRAKGLELRAERVNEYAPTRSLTYSLTPSHYALRPQAFGRGLSEIFAQAFCPKSLMLLALCFMLFACVLIHTAEGRGIGTSGSAALKIGIGAKSTSMGEASVAVADDVSSIYWNPAGLVQIRRSELSAMHVEWLYDIRYDWVGFAQPLASWATVAADVSYLYMGSMDRTIESLADGYIQNGTFTAADMTSRLALAVKSWRGILVGASLQMLQSKVDFSNVTEEAIEDKTARSTAIGLGCLYNTPVPNLSVGCSFQNWGRQTRAFIKEKEPLPFAFRLGAAYKVSVEHAASLFRVAGQKTESYDVGEGFSPSRNAPSFSSHSATRDPSFSSHSATRDPSFSSHSATRDSDESTSAVSADTESRASGVLIAAMDLDFSADDSVSARMGAEYRFGNGVAIRGGYKTGVDFPSGLSGGAGYSNGVYQVDYAFVPYGDIGSTHRVSFSIRF